MGGTEGEKEISVVLPRKSEKEKDACRKGGKKGGKEGEKEVDLYLDSGHFDVLGPESLHHVECILLAVVLEADGGLEGGREGGREGGGESKVA